MCPCYQFIGVGIVNVNGFIHIIKLRLTIAQNSIYEILFLIIS